MDPVSTLEMTNPDSNAASVTLLAPPPLGREASSRISSPVQSAWPAELAPLSVLRSRCAVGRFLGSAVFARQRALITVKQPVAASRRVRLSSRFSPSLT
jgi:hypothetical protein